MPKSESAVPELAIALAGATATTGTAYVVFGTAWAIGVAAASATAALVTARRLLPSGEPPESPPADSELSRSFPGYWRSMSRVSKSISSAAEYETSLRPALEHLLAARLAERHGVSLYREPDEAKRIFCAQPGAEPLWRWIDPLRVRDPNAHGRGIPHSALAHLIGRLEHL